MKITVCEDYAELSAGAADRIAGQIAEKTDCVLGLATGSTPEGAYAELVRRCAAGAVDFSRVTTFNLDEYYPLSADDPQSYHRFMWDRLFSRVNVRKDRVHIPDGTAADPAAACDAYEAAIRQSGGIDLQLLGIGPNGHIGFNEPGERLVAKTHLTGLTESTVKANARFFASEDEVPKQALTMGMATIFSARNILLLASGASKRAAVRALLDDGITTAVPATLLKLHPRVTLLCDRDAYGA